MKICCLILSLAHSLNQLFLTVSFPLKSNVLSVFLNLSLSLFLAGCSPWISWLLWFSNLRTERERERASEVKTYTEQKNN